MKQIEEATKNKLTQIFELLIVSVVSVVSIVMTCVGGSYMNDCSLQENIPIFLFVSGFSNLTLILTLIVLYFLNKRDKSEFKYVARFLIGLFILFDIAFNIAGSIWVFGKWHVWKESETNMKLCAGPLYKFAMAMLIIYWLAFPFMVFTVVKKLKDELV